MSALTMPAHKLSWKALACSIALHLLFFTTFILVFTPLKQSFKPEFLFLGSILKPQDLTSNSAQIRPADPWRSLKSTTQIDGVLLPNQASPVPQIDKPSQPLPTKEGKKIPTKSMVGEASNQIPKKRPTLDDLDYDIHLTPYKPLKLESK